MQQSLLLFDLSIVPFLSFDTVLGVGVKLFELSSSFGIKC